jgi:ankyrin repeat protein
VGRSFIFQTTALHLAALYGRTEMARLLCQRLDIDLSVENRVHETPLRVATNAGSKEIAKLLPPDPEPKMEEK